MKRLTTILLLSQVLWFAPPQLAHAQDVPGGMSYQAVVRNAQNELIANQRISIKVSIHQWSATGGVVYSETHSVETNTNGLASLVIGQGYTESGSYAAIDWAQGPYFVETEIDPNGGDNYTISSTTQMMSVPYAYYAEQAGNTFSGEWDDLLNVPSDIARTGDLAAVATTGSYDDLTGTPDLDSFATSDQLSDVALTGRYEDIEGAPTKVSELDNDAGYLTSRTIELTYDNNLGLGFVGGQNYVTLPIPSNVSQLANDAAYLDRETLKDNIAVNVSQPDEEGRVTIQLSDGEETFGEQRVVKLPTAVSELDNDANYLKEVDITIGLKDNTLTLTNATNEATSSVTLPSQLSEFENDEQFLRLDELEFRIEDGSVLVLRREDGSMVASVRLPETQGGGTQLPDGTNAGDLLYWSNNAWNVLPAGLEGQVLTFQSGGLTWSNPTVFDEQETYKPGDTFVNSSGVTEGIVLSIDPMTRTGLLLALNDVTANWSNVDDIIGATDTADGLANTGIVKAQSDWRNDYPAFSMVSDIGDQWYIPSFEEMKSIISEIDSMNDKLLSAGGNAISDACYATSTERTSTEVYGVATTSLTLEGERLISGGESDTVIDSIIPGAEGEDDTVIFHYELQKGDTLYVDKDTTVCFRPLRVMSWAELNSKPIEGKTYRPGDIYYASDGQTPLGVVYETSNSGHNGKMMALKETTAIWCTLDEDEMTRIGMDSDNGADNMSIMAASDGYSAENYPLITECSQDMPWYMPSYNEMRDIIEQYGIIQQALSSLGDKATPLSDETTYATSNEVEASATEVIGVQLKKSDDVPGTYDTITTALAKSSEMTTRAIREF